MNLKKIAIITVLSLSVNKLGASQKVDLQKVGSKLFDSWKVVSMSIDEMVEMLKNPIDELSEEERTRNLAVYSDLNNSFKDLKIKMNIPDCIGFRLMHQHNENQRVAAYAEKQDDLTKEEKELLCGMFKCYQEDRDNNGEAAHYLSHDKTVYLELKFFRLNPSSQLFVLIHELTHCRQHMVVGLENEWKNIPQKANEYEADFCAAQAIQCPLCFHSICDYESLNSVEFDDLKKQLGYFTKSDFLKTLETKTGSNLCETHKKLSDECDQFKKLLKEDSKKLSWYQIVIAWFNKASVKRVCERLTLDCFIGRLQERLSNVCYTFREQ